MPLLEELSREQKELVALAINERQVRKARINQDYFCEYTLRDDKGNCITQSAIHRTINEHIDECRKMGINCGILAPWRHGKTEQVVIGRTLKFLGENPNNRIFIVCNTDDNAAARVESISKYIEHSQEYHQVYPDVIPGSRTEWGKHKLVVKRASFSKDGSVEAWGITSSGTGAGCDFLIIDDPVDLRNAILNPAMRPQVKESFRNVWSSRVASNGFKIYIATVWHDDDLTSEIRKNSEWCFLVIKVAEDFSCFECESPLKGKFRIPLWEEQWSKEKLVQRCAEIGTTAFNRGYRQNAISDEDRTFKHYAQVFKYGVRWQDLVSPTWTRVAGMDPFGKMVVIFTIAIAPDGKRYPIEIRKGKWDSKQAVEQLIEAYHTHHHELILVENNAAQDAILQWTQEKDNAAIPVMAFTTGSNKANLEVGLPSMDVEFANNNWVCAVDGAHQPDCSCGVCLWRYELMGHPVASAADTVMASWMAREAARALQLGVTKEEEQHEETVHEDEAGLERVTIGEY